MMHVHRQVLSRRAIMAALATVALTAVLAACGSSSRPATAAHAPAPTPTRPRPLSPSCMWSEAINVTSHNVGYLDSHVNYWYDKLTLPAGAKLVVHGHYPAARYFALASYASSAAGVGVLTDSIKDVEIVPDQGSANPFLPDAARTGANGRSWTVTVSADKPPANPVDRRANTLYAGTRAPDQSQPVELIYRVYPADENFDIAGGGGLPESTVVGATGSQLTGAPACHALKVDTTPFTIGTLPVGTYKSLTHAPGSGPNAPAVNPGEWYRLLNPCHYFDEYYRTAGQALPTCPGSVSLTYWPNPDNAYVRTSVNRKFGPAPDGHNVLVVTGTMPTTPRTHREDARFAAGTQLRYWSLCTAESGVTTKTTVTDGCLYDAQVPLDAQRNYTIVISTPGDRPSNATHRCGVAWINWGNGDGAGDPAAGVLMLRNLVPDRSFAQAAQNVPAPGLPANVAATMGPYLPALQYAAPAQFEQRGCHPAAIEPEVPQADR
jgi:hypothetical protein